MRGLLEEVYEGVWPAVCLLFYLTGS